MNTRAIEITILIISYSAILTLFVVYVANRQPKNKHNK
jgi:hypothetical protein